MPSFPKPLIIGLGNPGFEYALTRHNAGFLFVDSLSLYYRKRDKNLTWCEKRDYAFFDASHFLLLKPYTYMNLSSKGIALFLKEEWGLEPASVDFSEERVLIVHDDMDVDPGYLKLTFNRSHAGHNGVKSVYQAFGRNLWRLRIGIGRKTEGDVVSYVLGKFSERELELLGWIMDYAPFIIEKWLRNPAAAASTFNSRKFQEERLRKYLDSTSS